MRASPALTLHLRRLMAALTVLAAFMFQARVGGSIEQVGRHAGHQAAASPATPARESHGEAPKSHGEAPKLHGEAPKLHGEAPKSHAEARDPHAGHAGSAHEGHRVPPLPAAPPTQAGTPTPPGQTGTPGPAHEHGAHCPFCVTSAFGEDVAAVVVPVGPLRLAEAAPPDAPQVEIVRLRGVNARAPPAGPV